MTETLCVNSVKLEFARHGYGWSDDFEAPHPSDIMHREADAIRALLNVLGAERAHIFEGSEGGSIALLAATAQPDRVVSLIFAAPHVFVEPLTKEAIVSFGQLLRLDETLARLSQTRRTPLLGYDHSLHRDGDGEAQAAAFLEDVMDG
jgi:pimeloyl-ACP methyl ester carboxylesterase